MKQINNISDLKKDKIYYIHATGCVYSRMKLRGKFNGFIENKDFIYFSNLEYVNHHYDHLRFPYSKPILLRLWNVNDKFYRFHLSDCVELAKTFPLLYPNYIIYEPENEQILINFIMQNSIINEAYFDWNKL